jgi:hypothetical protein
MCEPQYTVSELPSRILSTYHTGKICNRKYAALKCNRFVSAIIEWVNLVLHIYEAMVVELGSEIRH